MNYDQLRACSLVVCPVNDIREAHPSPSECSSAPNQQRWNHGRSCLQTSAQTTTAASEYLQQNFQCKTFCCSLWWKILCGGSFGLVCSSTDPSGLTFLILQKWSVSQELLQWSALSDRTAASCACSGKNCPKTLNCLSARASRSESCCSSGRRHGDRCRWTECSKHIIIVDITVSFRNKNWSRRWNIFPNIYIHLKRKLTFSDVVTVAKF